MNEKQLADVTRRIFGESGIRVKYTDRQGRHIWTDRDIAAGESVLVSQPYTLIVGEKHLEKVCHACFSVAENNEKFETICSSCNYAWYCSEECKSAHSESTHSRECGYLKQLKQKPLDVDRGFGRAKMRHLLRLLLQRGVENKLLAEGKELPSGPTFPDVAALVSHEVGSNAKEYTQIVNNVKSVLPKDLHPESTSELVELVRLPGLARQVPPRSLPNRAVTRSITLVRTDCNQFGLWSVDDDLLGVTVHPAASFFNHSCLPNCYCEWRGVNLVFKTLYPVKAHSELTISYIAGNEPTKKRKKELQRIYHFDCVCTRCVKSPDPSAPTAAYDAFFYRYLQCPRCTGVMKLDRKRRKPSQSQPTTPADANLEDRSCMTCSRKRPRTEKVPAVEDFLKKFDPESDLQYVPQKGEKSYKAKKVVPVLPNSDDEEEKPSAEKKKGKGEPKADEAINKGLEKLKVDK